MTDSNKEIELFRIVVTQKGNCCPKVHLYDRGNLLLAESIEFSASACEVPRITITKPIFNEEEIKGNDNDGN